MYTFVAIPLPFTGVWTGSAVAAFLGLPLPKALLAIVAGNVTAGGFITLLTFLFGDKVDLIIYILFGAIALILVGMLVFSLIRRLRKIKREQDAPQENPKNR